MDWRDLQLGVEYVGTDGTTRKIEEIHPVGADVGHITDKWDVVEWWDDDARCEASDHACAFALWVAEAKVTDPKWSKTLEKLGAAPGVYDSLDELTPRDVANFLVNHADPLVREAGRRFHEVLDPEPAGVLGAKTFDDLAALGAPVSACEECGGSKVVFECVEGTSATRVADCDVCGGSGVQP